MPFTPQELAAEHARAMRIVKAVLTACDARAATANAARRYNLKPGEAPWLLAIGKAAIGMAEGLRDVCGDPHRHLIITVDGPPALSITNILRSDHPLPTQRSLDAGQAVKRFIEEAKAAGAPSLTVLISGGASSLICEPIPGLELDDYRGLIAEMLRDGSPIFKLNEVRRAIDTLKGGELAALAQPVQITLIVISDVIGDALHDIGSGPFVQSPTHPRYVEIKGHENVRFALSFRPRLPEVPPPARTIIALNNAAAIRAAKTALAAEGMRCTSDRWDVMHWMTSVGASAALLLEKFDAGEALAWGGEWDISTGPGFGGRAQAVACDLADSCSVPYFAAAFATDGVDGTAPPNQPVAAGAAVWSGLTLPGHHDEDWLASNSYLRIAQRDARRRASEPPAHIFTGPTGTNVNDLLIAWRVK